MVRRVGGSGAGEFSIGSGDEQPPLNRLSQDTSKVGNFVTSHTKGETAYTLQGRIDPSFRRADYLQELKQHYAED